MIKSLATIQGSEALRLQPSAKVSQLAMMPLLRKNKAKADKTNKVQV